MAEEIIAPLAGKIISINIEVGSSVEEDDEVMIIEAMKMETSIYAPCDGIISKISISEGDEVEEDDVLAVVE
ncbi:MAG: acetyl-CoA carboxylase biotin carboxyl carrier protein subunit [Proteobacteria bacterium]|nr:acetyl-CoA carboxylase biotin carboxyl carrier protein subunit [Pseudomonadota bacterium]